MADTLEVRVIARIRSDFPTKFGIPRQSGLAETVSEIVFEPEYRNESALRGIEDFSHLWLLWHFSESQQEGWSPTVRPPRLGGNRRMGVFATRSPFRPSPVGLSSVKLLGKTKTPDRGTILLVSGADLMDGTPILDIKPYLAYTDSHPDAAGGFSDAVRDKALSVELPNELRYGLAPETASALVSILAQDPRPSYQEDPERIYGFPFAGYEIRFRVRDGVLTVLSIVSAPDP